jgi:undecaprenol kinase
MKNRSDRERLRYALAGVKGCWRSEASFRNHVWRGGLALLAMLAVRPAPLWWALAGLAVALILALELVNSAFERLIDHLHPEIHPEIGFIKDLAAGSVLMVNLGALAVAAALAVAWFRG